MAQRDTIDKIVEAYFAVITKEAFTYKGKTYRPRPLVVSPGIFRGFTCPAGCAGCCPVFSLDYLPHEPADHKLYRRYVEFNGNKIFLYSDMQTANKDHFCKYVNKDNGRCQIHGSQPFSCDFELIRSAVSSTVPNRLNTRLFGRGWCMLRVDNERGALCTITPPSEENREETLRKLSRLFEWSQWFGVNSWMPEILEYVQRNPIPTYPLRLGFPKKGLIV